MAESKELEKIKKLYGEDFMKLCRELFPTILEKEGLLIEILTSSFSSNGKINVLYNDIKKNEVFEEFKGYVYTKFYQMEQKDKEQEVIQDRTPYELLEEVGYNLFECNSEADIQEFRKYYEDREELCTFAGKRLNSCIVFWAVRKNVDEIRRENFKFPKREDEYGTSVMSIQFTKEEPCTVSIKNRYNHTLKHCNPDATYGNDLDRIIPGLTQSFAKVLAERGLELDNSNIEKLDLPGYTVANDGKYYKYNMEINNIYYCPGNIIIDHGNAIALDSDREILMDYFILDKKNKTLRLYDNTIEDSFITTFQDVEKIDVRKKDEQEKGVREVIVKTKNSDISITIGLNKYGNIINYENEALTKIENGFLRYNKTLANLSLINLESVGNDFLYNNQKLSKLELPNLTRVGNNFIEDNQELTQLILPNLRSVGNNFIRGNQTINYLELPELRNVGVSFLAENLELTRLELPKLTVIGNSFFYHNKKLEELFLPNVTEIGNWFFYYNNNIKNLELPKVNKIGNSFMCVNQVIGGFLAPNLEEVGDNFLMHYNVLNGLEFPNLTKTGRCFLNSDYDNQSSLTQYRKAEIEKILENTKVNRNKTIDSKDIAELDKETGITVTEMSLSKRILEKLRDFFKKTEYNQR